VNRIKTVLMRRQPAIVGLAAVLVALLVAPSSASVDPRGGTWNGKTAQGLPIEFVVKKKPKGWKVVTVKFQITATCTATVPDAPPVTQMVTTPVEFPVRRADDGTIDGGNRYLRVGDRWTWVHSGGDQTASSGLGAQGKFVDRRKAKGYVQRDTEFNVLGNHGECHSGKVRWTAHR
jgi:hypothetical protein